MIRRLTRSASNETACPYTRIIRSTWNRFPCDRMRTRAPTVTLGAEGLDDRGAQDLNESVAELPCVSQSNSATSDGGNAQSEGLSTIELRSLGDNRTLVDRKSTRLNSSH